MQTVKNILELISDDTQKLRDGKITPEHANAVSRLTQVYINTLKLEITSGVKVAEIVGHNAEITGSALLRSPG